MKVRIHDVSSISHMTYHNGKPCDKYTATVKVGLDGRPGWGGGVWYLRVYATTQAALELKLSKMCARDVFELKDNDLGNLYRGDKAWQKE